MLGDVIEEPGGGRKEFVAGLEGFHLFLSGGQTAPEGLQLALNVGCEAADDRQGIGVFHLLDEAVQ